jgi:hypothetical protein
LSGTLRARKGTTIFSAQETLDPQTRGPEA